MCQFGRRVVGVYNAGFNWRILIIWSKICFGVTYFFSLFKNLNMAQYLSITNVRNEQGLKIKFFKYILL